MPAPGLRLTVLAGATLPVPIPATLAATLRSVTVTENDQERSVFTLTFDAGRSGSLGASDIPGLSSGPLAANCRVVVVVTFGAVPTVLMDGILTQLELIPGDAPGGSLLRATGEDISVLLDRTERDVEHAALEDSLQVLKILAPYAAQGIAPLVIPPSDMDPPLPMERTPTQQGTDLQHLQRLAGWHGYVTYAIPGPLPGASTFYWGPAIRVGLPQPALSIDLGPDSNVVGRPRFRQDALGPTFIEGTLRDSKAGRSVPIKTSGSLRVPLAAMPVWSSNSANVRTRRFRDSGPSATTGQARAQAATDSSIDCVVGQGELDGARYASVLRPRGLVGIRGAGWSHDGLWYVTAVEHTLEVGSYRQSFTVVREGYGSTVPVVPV